MYCDYGWDVLRSTSSWKHARIAVFLLFVYNIIVKHDTNIIHVHIWIYNGNWFPKYHNNNMLDDALDAVRASWAIGLFTVVFLPFWINLLVRIALARASSYLSLMNFVIRNFTHRTAVLFGCALLLADSSSKRSNKICIANTRTIAFVRCYARRMIWWCVAAIKNVCYPYNNCIIFRRPWRVSHLKIFVTSVIFCRFCHMYTDCSGTTYEHVNSSLNIENGSAWLRSGWLIRLLGRVRKYSSYSSHFSCSTFRSEEQ